jgi:type 1 glutamine amidotransferase
MLWGLVAVMLAVNASPGISGRTSLSSFSEELGEETRMFWKQEPLRILFFTKTSGFRHSSIPVAIQAMEKMVREQGWEAVITEDAEMFTESRLKGFHVVVFLLTTGDVLNRDQEQAMEAFIRSGKGFVGIHSAADTEYEWAWYGKLVGAYFKSHPAVQKARVVIEDSEHPTVRFLPRVWEREDEWYDYRENPREHVKVLARVDEASYRGGTMGADHPIIWCREFEGGRSWYTGMGHTEGSYQDELFLRTIAEAIKWAARRSEG